MQKTAYGALALKPWELGRLTPGEYALMVEGYNQRQEEHWQELRWAVWHAAMLPYFEKQPQMKEFVGLTDKTPAPVEPQSVEQMRSIMAGFAVAMNQGRR